MERRVRSVKECVCMLVYGMPGDTVCVLLCERVSS